MPAKFNISLNFGWRTKKTAILQLKAWCQELSGLSRNDDDVSEWD